MGGVNGDFAELKALIGRLRIVMTPAQSLQMCRGLAHEALHQVHEGFVREESPQGVPWKPSWSANTLRVTGRLRNSISVRAYERGFTLATNAKYATIHQYGGTIHAKNARTYSYRARKRIGRVIGADGKKTAIWSVAAGRTFKPKQGKPMLRWRSTTGFRIAGRGGKRLKSPVGITGFFQKESVTIPPRPFIPEHSLGRRWTSAMDAEATRIFGLQMAGGSR